MWAQFRILAYLGGAAIVGVSSLLYYYQNDIIYVPNFPTKGHRNPDSNPIGYQNPDDRDLPYQDIYLHTRDGHKLHSWLITQTQSDAPTLLFFHANAGNMGLRMDIIEQFYRQIGVNIFIISYRGYGKSTGSPSEMGLQIDAETAVTYLFEQSNINKDKIFIYGSSLGGAVGIYAAHKFKD